MFFFHRHTYLDGYAVPLYTHSCKSMVKKSEPKEKVNYVMYLLNI